MRHDGKAIDHCQVKGEEKDVIIPFHLGCRIMTAQGQPSLTWTFCDHLAIFGTGPTRLTSFRSYIGGKRHAVDGFSIDFFWNGFSVFILRDKTVRESNQIYEFKLLKIILIYTQIIKKIPDPFQRCFSCSLVFYSFIVFIRVSNFV